MSLTDASKNLGASAEFGRAAGKRRRKSPPPFSLRLNAEERARLTAEAAGTPLGAYIKHKALGAPPPRRRRAGATVEDGEALARVLAMLGQSKLANNLSQLVRAAASGSLVLTPDIEAALRDACDNVRIMRADLLRALGFVPEAET